MSTSVPEENQAKPIVSSVHKCFESADEVLGKRNTKLTFAMQLPGGEERLVIATERVNKRQKPTEPVKIMANFCPFCGEHLR